jgi:hypothetical protein
MTYRLIAVGYNIPKTTVFIAFTLLAVACRQTPLKEQDHPAQTDSIIYHAMDLLAHGPAEHNERYG